MKTFRILRRETKPDKGVYTYKIQRRNIFGWWDIEEYECGYYDSGYYVTKEFQSRVSAEEWLDKQYGRQYHLLTDWQVV